MPVKSYKDKNGKTKYYCSFYYTDYNGTKKRKKIEGFLRSKDAKQAEADFLEKASGSSTMSFRALCDIYMEDCKTRLKPTTYSSKKYLFDERIIPFFDNKPITDIKPAMIRKWQNNLLSHEPAYSQTYVRLCNNQLSTVFNYACKYYGLKSNPVRIAGTIGKTHSGRIDFYTVSEYNKFINAIDDAMYRMAFELLFYTGCRCGELMALTVSDFDSTAKTININKNLAIVGKEVLVLSPKTPKSKRIIALPDKVNEHLKQYVGKMYEPKPNERIFPLINKHKLAEVVSKTSKKAGIKRIRVHDFRHSHASLLIELGFSPLVISERLGHEDVKTTLSIYSHLYPTKAEEVAKKLNAFVN